MEPPPLSRAERGDLPPSRLQPPRCWGEPSTPTPWGKAARTETVLILLAVLGKAPRLLAGAGARAGPVTLELASNQSGSPHGSACFLPSLPPSGTGGSFLPSHGHFPHQFLSHLSPVSPSASAKSSLANTLAASQTY
ncbi:Golgi SNAP receptor complex member 2 [Platysternon megacephalum]|uniref:Golgi SNAP receptor complex member 2 n=1 Tax=Platysternon megacephalum TaxID=55544 RepID=A0A4D9E1K7_9SAUR|nr:Golgi SNAP receptor complex member 2 [Platysternon megacephalum]